MARRRNPVIDEHRLQVLLGAAALAPVAVEPDARVVDRGPDTYGVRVTYLTSRERLEAADFLIATRARQETRLRAVRAVRRGPAGPGGDG